MARHAWLPLLLALGLVPAAGCYQSTRIDVADASPDAATLDGGSDASSPDSGSNDAAIADASLPTHCPLSATPMRLALTRTFACVIGNDCKLSCWGTNGSGQLGVGDTTPRSTPTPVAGGPWLEVAGDDFSGGPAEFELKGTTCALDATGHESCWGSGTATTGLSDALVPRVAFGRTFRHIAGAETRTNVGSDGALLGYGDNWRGVAGTGGSAGSYCEPTTTGANLVPIGPGTGFDTVYANRLVRFALRGGELWGWGLNGSGTLVPGSTLDQCTPIRVGTDSDWSSIGPGFSSCGLRNGGELYCWGDNQHGSADPNDPALLVATPRRILPDSKFLQVSSDYGVTCAVRDDHALFCWGRHSGGSLWPATTDPIVQVGKDHAWAWAITSTDPTRICAATTSDELYCWGYNGDGLLPFPGVTTTLVPTRIDLP